jgi:V8-like Glu-specific endopeptidase
MAVGYTRRHTERFAREAIRTEQTPVVSQTAPEYVRDDARDAARLELACVRTWVKEEDTRESVRETTRFPHDGEAVIKPDVLDTEIDIRTVAVIEPV